MEVAGAVVNIVPVDYARLDYHWQQHHARFAARVERDGLLCQECGGAGGEVDVILDDGTGPWEPCGYCEGTGRVTRWLRGLWLRHRQQMAAFAKKTKD